MDHHNHELQEKYVGLQNLEAQMKQIQQQIMAINQQGLELRKVDDDLNEFENVKENSNMFFSLGPGIFAEGTITNKDLLLNVGSNVSVRKSIPETKKLITEQIHELDALSMQLQQDLQIFSLKGQELEQELIKLNNNTEKSK